MQTHAQQPHTHTLSLSHSLSFSLHHPHTTRPPHLSFGELEARDVGVDEREDAHKPLHETHGRTGRAQAHEADKQPATLAVAQHPGKRARQRGGRGKVKGDGV